MPHPGLRVCTSPEFDGKLKDVEKDFKLKIICTLNKPKLIDIPVDTTKIKLIELKKWII